MTAAMALKAQDANDILRQEGPGALREQFDRAHRKPKKPKRSPPYLERCVADVSPEPITWFWSQRLACGKINLVAGNPGLGKSQLSTYAMAAVTTGGLWPDGTRSPKGSVILISCEDDAADTLRPRLEAAGADLTKVHLLDWIVDPERPDAPRQHFDIGQHSDQLEAMVEAIGDVRLIVVDPVTAYLGGADSHKTADVRAALAPLQSLAGRHGVAVILISHLNKSGGDNTAMNRVVGSGAFVAVARSAWLVGDDPQDSGADRRRRILTPLKNNIGDDRTGFAFTVEGVTLPNGIGTSRVVFEPGTVEISAAELLQGQSESSAQDSGAVGEAEEFLKQNLAGGPRPAKDVEKDAKAAWVSKRTLMRARRNLKVKSRKSSGGSWLLSLPEQAGA
jgi:hypothetical protein